jgi:hypothetical protein
MIFYFDKIIKYTKILLQKKTIYIIVIELKHINTNDSKELKSASIIFYVNELLVIKHIF